MNGYCYFILGILVLAAGYFTYGRVLERIFRPDASRQTPAVACTDGVDYVVMPRWRVFLIQLLNIAGLGPIFGAVMGVLYGPAALLWIVFGCILGGMAHDYFSGMISLRHKGENLPEILGRYLGSQAQWISRAVCIVFSVLVGVVFAVGPAAILAPMTGWSVSAWVWIIFGYYFLATILPIQAIMGKVYPLFSVALIIMVVGILGVMLLAPFAEFMPYWMHIPSMEVLPDLDFFHNRHPADFPLFPVMFITIACGAVSGFHATQSPLMARCLKTEQEGLPVFGGAMITEGIIAFIWAAAALTFYGTPEALGAATANGKAPALAIQMISESWMGHVGSILVWSAWSSSPSARGTAPCGSHA
ncbi:MAG: carbon starvation CstA family protein [Akkermansia muciniphila]